MNVINQLPVWLQVVTFAIGLLLFFIFLYMITRVISTACVNSWWEARIKHTKKLLDVFKENPQEGKNGKS